MRRLLLSIVIAVAFFFCLQAVWLSCRFFEFETETGTVIASGLFKISYRHDQCLSIADIRKEWSDAVEFSHSTKAARTFGVMASILGAVAVLFAVLGSCFLSFFPSSKRLWRSILSGSLLGAFVCQSFTFLIFHQVMKEMECDKPENSCRLGFGGICSVVAAVLYLLAGLAVLWCALQPPKENPGTTYLAKLGQRMMDKMGITWKASPLQNIRGRDILLLICSILLFLCSLTVLVDCRFFVVDFSNNTREYAEGLMSYHYYPDDTCRRFERGSKESFTALTKAAIGFGIIAAIFGGLIMSFLWSGILLVNYPTTIFKVLPALAFMAGLSQPLTFLSNSERYDNLCAEDIEDQSCQLGADGFIAAIATCLYILFIPFLMWYGNNPNVLVHEEDQEEEGLGKEREEEAPAEAPIDAESGKDI